MQKRGRDKDDTGNPQATEAVPQNLRSIEDRDAVKRTCAVRLGGAGKKISQAVNILSRCFSALLAVKQASPADGAVTAAEISQVITILTNTLSDVTQVASGLDIGDSFTRMTDSNITSFCASIVDGMKAEGSTVSEAATRSCIVRALSALKPRCEAERRSPRVDLMIKALSGANTDSGSDSGSGALTIEGAASRLRQPQ